MCIRDRTQYRPSVLAYSVMETITKLCHDQHCINAQLDTTASSVTTAGLQTADIRHCTIAVMNFLHSTGAGIVYPVFY